jgi:hypothetical protein
MKLLTRSTEAASRKVEENCAVLIDYRLENGTWSIKEVIVAHKVLKTRD